MRGSVWTRGDPTTHLETRVQHDGEYEPRVAAEVGVGLRGVGVLRCSGHHDDAHDAQQHGQGFGEGGLRRQHHKP